jgi:phosphate-selective porin OprO/OprP
MHSYGLEVAWLDGPWSFQGEYLSNNVTGGIRQNFFGFYGYASYFFTGESRHYDTTTGFSPVLRRTRTSPSAVAASARCSVTRSCARRC